MTILNTLKKDLAKKRYNVKEFSSLISSFCQTNKHEIQELALKQSNTTLDDKNLRQFVLDSLFN